MLRKMKTECLRKKAATRCGTAAKRCPERRARTTRNIKQRASARCFLCRRSRLDVFMMFVPNMSELYPAPYRSHLCSKDVTHDRLDA